MNTSIPFFGTGLRRRMSSRKNSRRTDRFPFLIAVRSRIRTCACAETGTQLDRLGCIWPRRMYVPCGWSKQWLSTAIVCIRATRIRPCISHGGPAGSRTTDYGEHSLLQCSPILALDDCRQISEMMRFTISTTDDSNLSATWIDHRPAAAPPFDERPCCSRRLRTPRYPTRPSSAIHPLGDCKPPEGRAA